MAERTYIEDRQREREIARLAPMPAVSSTTQGWRDFFMSQPTTNLVADVRNLRWELQAWRNNWFGSTYYPRRVGYDWVLAVRLCAMARAEIVRRRTPVPRVLVRGPGGSLGFDIDGCFVPAGAFERGHDEDE